MILHIEIIQYRIAIMADCQQKEELVYQITLVVDFMNLPGSSLVEKS